MRTTRSMVSPKKKERAAAAKKKTSKTIPPRPRPAKRKTAARKQRGRAAAPAAAPGLTTVMGLSIKFAHHNILSWLSINETTKLGRTCRQMRQEVSSLRSANPYSIIWERRCPTKIGYQGFIDTQWGVSDGRIEQSYDDDDSSEDGSEQERPEHDLVFGALQLQPFEFLLRTAKGVLVQVTIQLQNEAWDEHNNTLNGRGCRPSNEFPTMKTRPAIRIVQLAKRGSKHKVIFDAAPNAFAYWDQTGEAPSWGYEGGIHMFEHFYYTNPVELTTAENKRFRCAMVYLLMCAKRVENYPDRTIYNSAAYIMRMLPAWLYQYFPKNFDWEVNCQDRKKLKIEFKYRPARSFEEWKEFVAKDFYETIEYNLDELPWYRRKGKRKR
mmetsp:Transcript_5833/g.9690  ORF Transcript_5833/g.9690 Transcript_5833/m.9690 type:complete len:381 (+) Transcript_5833:89-1231(+)|eukprot:CAMPEP_0119005172 /NCGR_PEP_ID=MMETSP1176-20130426/1567_1 /TAXON_ID=265551 /ORGANISM="Synedropsis recta cf, Strain CCMP1620" /LENGTH=380 /DNA_ID=CAMNT_0006956949 /DNA_START=89 /DNA_END=1231 /DNA_ORIENTATION=+